LPVTAPRSCDDPSPQLTLTFVTKLPLAAAAVTAKVNNAGNPALGGVVGGVITSAGADAISTTICAVAWPVALGVVGVVGVVPPELGGVVVEPP